MNPSRHPREGYRRIFDPPDAVNPNFVWVRGGDPPGQALNGKTWIPAFAGMTMKETE